jgi:hypothetical protein
MPASKPKVSIGLGRSHMPDGKYCDLVHSRSVPATVRLEIKSTRTSHPGHPMTRVVTICASHARELRRLGLEFVSP